MSLNYSHFCQKFVLSLFGLLSFAGLFSGMFLCLIKSPQAQSEKYLSLAEHYITQANANNSGNPKYFLDVSEDMTLKAISYSPYDDRAWKKLSAVKGNYQILQELQGEQSLAFSSLD